MNSTLSLSLIIFLIAITSASKDWSEDQKPSKWNSYSQQRINKMLNRKLNGNVAKNIILFLGDGMGPSTVTAGRMLKGQNKKNNGEEEVTNLENLDHLALSKTYSIDAQTSDSAGTATAYLTGVKTRMGVIGLDGTAVDCKSSQNAKLESILKWAHYAGKSTGIVTNTRVTHATPAGAYAHSQDRDWEAYDDITFGKELKKQGCKDIAAQLVEDNSFINVVFGGGRLNFMGVKDADFQDKNKFGIRTDGRNLINEWIDNMYNKGLKHRFIWNMKDLDNLKPGEYDHILGLFSRDHMEFEIDRVDDNIEPSLIDMTKKAIEMLKPNPNGFFLLVEGGNIDRAHHKSLAKKSLNEFVVFDNALGVALNNTSDQDTLIIGTADHSHVFTIGGYQYRGSDLFGINNSGELPLSASGVNFTPLLYANGPGGLKKIRTKNLTNSDTNKKKYQQESAVLLDKETHGGEDVAIFAKGPMSYLFDGTVEQSYIAHVMAYSACIGPYNSSYVPDCKQNRGVLIQ